MGRSKSGYKRSYTYQPPAGIWIEIKIEENYQKLKACAKSEGLTIGQWAEAALRYALSGEPYIPPYRHTGPATPTARARGFRLSDMTWAWVETTVGEDKAHVWIGRTLIAIATIQLTRIRGEQAESEWALRYRI